MTKSRKPKVDKLMDGVAIAKQQMMTDIDDTVEYVVKCKNAMIDKLMDGVAIAKQLCPDDTPITKVAIPSSLKMLIPEIQIDQINCRTFCAQRCYHWIGEDLHCIYERISLDLRQTLRRNNINPDWCEYIGSTVVFDTSVIPDLGTNYIMIARIIDRHWEMRAFW